MNQRLLVGFFFKTNLYYALEQNETNIRSFVGCLWVFFSDNKKANSK